MGIALLGSGDPDIALGIDFDERLRATFSAMVGYNVQICN